MNIIFWLSGIIIFLFAIVVFFLLQDKERLLNFRLKKYEENRNHSISVKAKVDVSLFVQGMSIIDFVHIDFKNLKKEIHKKIVGLDSFINAIIVNILCGGHILVEWVPGLAKTKMIRTFSEVMNMEFKRIQFTPDLLPSDILWVDVYNHKTKNFETKLGPIVSNIILADEINRATPKVQSALLEWMQEQQITIGGKTFELPDPFFVLATQNPLEHEGTYPLPEAQIDRFLFKILLDYPTLQQEIKVLESVESEKKVKLKKILTQKKFVSLKKWFEKVLISEEVKSYIGRLVVATRKKDSRLEYGASPRGSIGLMLSAKAVAFLEWRDFVKHEDVQKVFLAVMRHRIVLSYDAKIDWLTEDDVLLDIVSEVGLF